MHRSPKIRFTKNNHMNLVTMILCITHEEYENMVRRGIKPTKYWYTEFVTMLYRVLW